LKTRRLRKQARALRKKIRGLSDRENQNIVDLKAEEAFERRLAAMDSVPSSSEPTSGVPPSLTSFSQVSFGFLNRTSLVPTNSS
jgi:hypothetical protein